MTERTACSTPAEGRDGVINIPTWKFEALRTAILAGLAQGECGFDALRDKAKREMSASDLAKLGSFAWHFTTVKLELEVRGEIERTGGKGRQVLRLTPLRS